MEKGRWAMQQTSKLKSGLVVILTVILTWLVLLPPSQAAQVDLPRAQHHSTWVSDGAQVLSDDTLKQIDALNEGPLSRLKGHPQYAVVTVKQVPGKADDINNYASDLFESLGLGRKGWDNGVLFLIATDDHRYKLEVGYGLESALTDSSKNQIMTAKVEEALKANQLDSAVRQVSQNTVNVLEKRRADIMTPSSIKQARKDQQRLLSQGLALVMFVLGLGLVGTYLRVAAQRRQRKRAARIALSRMGLKQPRLRARVQQLVNNDAFLAQAGLAGRDPKNFKQADWWLLANYANLSQYLSQVQPVMSTQVANPAYQAHLISWQTYQQYLHQLQALKEAHIRTLIQATATYLQHWGYHYSPQELIRIQNQVVQAYQAEDNPYNELTTDHIQKLIQQAYYDVLCFEQYGRQAEHLTASQRRSAVDPSTGLVNALLLSSLLSHQTSGQDTLFGGDGGFSDFGSGFGGGNSGGGGFGGSW